MRTIFQIGWFFLFIVGLNSPCFSQSLIITTYVGPAMPVNGGLAIDQAIDVPQSVAPDGTGGFYVTSVLQNRVYRVSTDGKLSVAAGDGSLGFSGDGGPSTLARLRISKAPFTLDRLKSQATSLFRSSRCARPSVKGTTHSLRLHR
jgi:hypothetical protein